MMDKDKILSLAKIVILSIILQVRPIFFSAFILGDFVIFVPCSEIFQCTVCFVKEKSPVKGRGINLMFTQRNNPYCDLLQLVLQK